MVVRRGDCLGVGLRVRRAADRAAVIMAYDMVSIDDVFGWCGSLAVYCIVCGGGQRYFSG